MARDLDLSAARTLVESYLAKAPPKDDVWLITNVTEYDWGWAFSWANRRRIVGSRASSDTHAGGGPYLVDRRDGRVARAGSAHPAVHYIDLWRAGSWPDLPVIDQVTFRNPG